MRAVRVHVSGEGSQLRMDDVPPPDPRPNQVLVRVAAIGVNRADLARRSLAGQGDAVEPFIPGLDVAGTIEAVGSEVTNWRAGDRVMALMRGGAYAQLAPARGELTYLPPEGMSLQDAASIPCVFLTAWYGLTKVGQVREGETVVIHAAGSGVGIAGIQIARALGARVLTSAGTDAKVAKGLELGAEAGVNYSTQDVAAEFQRLTEGRGVDVVLDSVGGPIFDATLRALAPGGRVVTVGNPAGDRSEVNQAALEAQGQRVQRVGVLDDALADAEGNGWAQLKAWFDNGTLHPVVDRVLPWAQAEVAHRLLQERAVFGKVYVSVASSPTTSMPSTKLRMRALRSGIVPSCRKSRKSATYRAISSVLGSSTLRCSSWVSASSRAASNCSSRCRREKMRGERTSRVSSLVSMAS